MLAWTVCKILGLVLVIAHWFACCYWLIAIGEGFEGRGTLWVQRRHEDYLLSSNDEQYITALYWAVQTMCTVGYGDFSPKNSSEQIYVTVCMLISAGIYSLSLENVERIIRKHDMLAEQFREHMLYVN